MAAAAVVDGVIIAGDPLFRRCCDLAEFIPNLFSPHFAIANFEPAELHGLYIENKVMPYCHLFSLHCRCFPMTYTKEVLVCSKY